MSDGEFGLTYGSLDWSPAAQSGDVTVEVYGLRRGRPVPVVSVVQTLLQDGTSEQVEREDNRDVSVLIGIQGADSQALAEYEALLRAEVARERNELTYTAPDGFGFPTVFDVLWADLQPFDGDGWDLDEVLRGRRLYSLVLRCLPFARSVDEVEVVATPTAATPTVLDDGSSTANWSNWNGVGGAADPNLVASATTVGGRTVIRYTNGVSSMASRAVKWTGSADDDYVGLTTFGEYTVLLYESAGGGLIGEPLAVEEDGSWVTYYWRNPGASALFFSVGNTDGSPFGVGTDLYVDAAVESQAIGSDSVFAATVYGSVRTTGRFSVERADGTGGLGWLTLYTDPTMANGAWHPALPGTWTTAPEGTYAFWMDPRVGVVEVTVTDAGGQSQTMTTQGPWTNQNTGDVHPDWLPVGEITLGGTYDGLVGELTFEVKVDGIIVTDPQTPRLFRRHRDTSLTHVLMDGDLAEVASQIVVESPSIDRPFGGVWADGRSVIAKCVSWEDPTFAPGTTLVFVEADNSTADPVEVTAAYPPRWHTHAGR